MKLVALLFLTLAQSALLSQENNMFINKQNAIEHAQENNTNILMVFAGSDWCRPCIKFKKDILETADFKAYADDNLTILYLDFPAKKKNKLSADITLHHEKLAEQYNKSGTFPKIILADHSLEEIKTLKYTNQGTRTFINLLQL